MNILIYWLFSTLVIFNIANANCLYSKSISNVKCKKTEKPNSNILINPAFISYRMWFYGSTERKCRLEPTCSLFLLKSSRKFGIFKGILYSFARAQMSHGNDLNLLSSIFWGNEFNIHLDDVKNWEFDNENFKDTNLCFHGMCQRKL